MKRKRKEKRKRYKRIILPWFESGSLDSLGKHREDE